MYRCTCLLADSEGLLMSILFLILFEQRKISKTKIKSYCNFVLIQTNSPLHRPRIVAPYIHTCTLCRAEWFRLKLLNCNTITGSFGVCLCVFSFIPLHVSQTCSVFFASTYSKSNIMSGKCCNARLSSRRSVRQCATNNNRIMAKYLHIFTLKLV